MTELGTACVALHARPPLRQSWLGLALTSGLLHHSHRHTAPAWDVGIQGHHPQETRQKPSPTPFLTEGTLSTESTSYPGCFQFVRLEFCTQDCSTWEITAGETWSAEKHHTNQTNQVPGARRKEINPRLDSWHRNGGSWVLQPVCGLATQTPNHSAYFCCVQVQWVCISGQHTPHNDPSIKLNWEEQTNLSNRLITGQVSEWWPLVRHASHQMDWNLPLKSQCRLTRSKLIRLFSLSIVFQRAKYCSTYPVSSETSQSGSKSYSTDGWSSHSLCF